MRIAVVYLGRRGSGGLISLALCKHLAHHADVLAVYSDQVANLSAWQQASFDQMTVATYRSFPQAVRAWLDQPQQRRIADQIRAWQPDVLLFPMFYTLNPFLQRHLADIPSLVAVHDPIPHPGLVDRVYAWLENWSIQQAQRCLVFSRALMPALQARGVSLEQIDVIPHGVLAYPPGTTDDSDQSLALLFFGRITAYKGLDILIKAYARLCVRYDLRLRIVGAGDLRPYRAQLENLPNVEIVNRWVDDFEVHRFFRPNQIVVLPYTSASQSGVIAVAANFGLPVVTTRTGGLPEQIQDGVTGVLVEPGSVDHLSNAIEDLLNHPQKAVQLGQALFQDFAQNRNWGEISSQVVLACEKALTGY
ncbi:MAG TPA: glycosyltransferase [Anaerolineales bacterium]|nr:glycosyltransferase [Anaerolineales bacterium]